MKKKNIVIILIISAILIGIVVFLVMQSIKKESRKYSIEKVEEYNYFVLQDKDKFGVIDKNSNIVLEPKYQNIVIPNPSKALFICTPFDENVKVLNEKNEQQFTNYDEVYGIRLKNIASDLMYEKSVLKYKKDGKYGLIDYNGKEITKPIYGSIDALEYKEGELIVEQDGKYGVINIKGTSLVKNEYQTINVDNNFTDDNDYKNTGYIVGIKTEEGYRYGYLDAEENKILDTEFNEITRVSNINDEKNLYFIVSKKGQYGVYKNSAQIINTEYQSIDYNKTNNIFVLEKSRKFGIVDIDAKNILDIKYSQIDINGKYIYAKDTKGEVQVFDGKGNKVEISANVSKNSVENGKYSIKITNETNKTFYGVEDENQKEIIPSKYTYIEYLFDNYFIASNQEGLLGVLNDKNEVKVDFKYNSIQRIKDLKLVQASNSQEKINTIFNSNMEKICELKSASVAIVGDYIKISNNEKVIYLDEEGKQLTNKEVYPNNELYAKEENGKWGFEDKTGVEKIKPEYDRVTEFNEFGYAGIYKDGKWGVIDSAGKVIQEPKYKIQNNNEPEFLGKYYKVIYGFGEFYFTNK